MRSRLFLAVLLLLPATVAAQAINQPNGSISVSVSPQYPAPYSQATLSFLSPSLNLANATLAVSVGGKEIYRGSVQPVSVSLGRAGSVTNATATVTINGVPYRQSVVIQPQDVMLIAEPSASAPPLYKGKPFAPVNGSVRVVAVSNLRDAAGKTLDPSTLSYAWTVDGTRIPDSSGIGKSSILIASPLEYRQRAVSVLVVSQDGSLVGGDSVSFSPSEPSVRIYENDPLLGIRYDRALSGAYAIAGAESTLYAATFSLPTSESSSLSWSLNGTNVENGHLITLRPTGNGQGTASLSFTASVNDYTASESLSLSFGSKSPSFFGL